MGAPPHRTPCWVKHCQTKSRHLLTGVQKVARTIPIWDSTKLKSLQKVWLANKNYTITQPLIPPLPEVFQRKFKSHIIWTIIFGARFCSSMSYGYISRYSLIILCPISSTPNCDFFIANHASLEHIWFQPFELSSSKILSYTRQKLLLIKATHMHGLAPDFISELWLRREVLMPHVL